MAPPTLVMATKNPGKVRELAALLSGLGFKLLSLTDFPEIPEIPEEGATFAENARTKALAAARLTGLPALADDSGLEVAALQGRPGVHSARYAADRTAPHPPSDRDNWQKLLKEMAGVPWEERQARFVCDVALALPDGRLFGTHGECPGYIALKPRGDQGFGYDPVFWLPEYKATVAEVGLEVKNQISHRAQALEKLKELLLALQEDGVFTTPGPFAESTAILTKHRKPTTEN